MNSIIHSFQFIKNIIHLSYKKFIDDAINIISIIVVMIIIIDKNDCLRIGFGEVDIYACIRSHYFYGPVFACRHWYEWMMMFIWMITISNGFVGRFRFYVRRYRYKYIHTCIHAYIHT